MRPLTLAALLAVLSLAAPTGAGGYTLATSTATATAPQHGAIVDATRRARAHTWRIEHWLGKPRSPYPGQVTAVSYERRLYLLDLWRSRAGAWYQRWVTATKPLVCIHGYEGAWNDPNPSYYGGLQMDLSFQERWGPYLVSTKGTADHWTANEQLRVAYRAVLHVGYGPWPNTRIPCGV